MNCIKMADSVFQLKQFNVKQRSGVFKLGTDSILLGAWAQHPAPTSVLDIGTGTGIIALMLAQRFQKALITAVDIHKESVQLAQENFSASPWTNRLNAMQHDIKDFQTGPFDLITCNPPYFQDSYKSHDTTRNRTRQNMSLSLSDLFDRVTNLLHDSGNFCLILPSDSILPTSPGLHLSRKKLVKGHENAPIKRMLLTYSKTPGKTILEPDLVIESSRHNPTPQHHELTREFYLHF